MKPIRLEVEGLQSYQDPVVVDFDSLGRYGLFGIFGPIGSGKSSLLDALTLALYGLVDRVAGRSKKGVINADAEKMEVRLLFSVRSPEGVAETYEVQRSYRAVDGGTQRVASRLTQHTEGSAPLSVPLVLADKEREVNEAIEAIVGLCADDFMRAVVLPQGRFLDVLHLKGSERRGMLQRIFRLSAYGAQLRTRLRGRQQEQRERLAAIEGELQGLGPASKGAVREARAHHEAAMKARGDAAEAQEQARRLHDAASLARRSHGQLAEARSELTALEAEAEGLAEQRRQMAEAEALWPQRGATSRWHQARRRALEAADDAHTVAATATAAEAAADAATRRHQAAQLAHQEQGAILGAELRDVDALLRRLRTDAGLDGLREQAARRAIASRQRRDTIDASLGDAREELAEIEPRRRSLKRKLARERVAIEERRQVAEALEAHRRLVDARRDHEAATDAAYAAEDALAATRVQVATARAEADAIADRLATAEAGLLAVAEGIDATPAEAALLQQVGRERIDALASALRQLDAAKAATTKARQARDVAEAALAETDARQGAAESEHQAAEAEWRAHQQAHAAALLAADLPDGEPCPVCGSAEHPTLAVPPPGARERPDDAHLVAARARRSEAAEALAAAAAQLASTQSVRKAHGTVANAALAAIDALLPGASTPLEEAPERLLEAERALVHARKAAEAAQARRMAHIEAEREVHGLRLHHERALGPLRAAEADEQRALQQLTRATQAVDDASAVVGTAWSAWSEVAGDRITLFDVPQLQRRIDDRDAQARDLERSLAEADARREVLQQTIADLQQERSLAVTDVAEADAHRAATEARWAALHGEALAALARAAEDGAPAPSLAELTDALDTHRHRLGNAMQRMEAMLFDAANHREIALAEAARASAARAAAEAAERAAAHALEEAWTAWVEAAPELVCHGEEPGRARPLPPAIEQALAELAERVAALPAPERLARWKADLESHRQARQRLLARIEALDGSGEPPPSDDAFAALEEALADAARALDAATELVARRRGEHDALVQRLARVEVLHAQRTEATIELERLDHLGSLLRGDRFVEFVANDLLRELAATATQHLRTLSEGRYGLVLDDQGGFLVQDADTGGTTRPVTSLSGGESFLSALALALALSTQIQARGAKPLEFFFLDEGFGSLDPEALDRVMSAIERLKDGHRIIGLISHVPGVRERIPMHLVVHPAGTRQRGSSVELRIQ